MGLPSWSTPSPSHLSHMRSITRWLYSVLVTRIPRHTSQTLILELGATASRPASSASSPSDPGWAASRARNSASMRACACARACSVCGASPPPTASRSRWYFPYFSRSSSICARSVLVRPTGSTCDHSLPPWCCAGSSPSAPMPAATSAAVAGFGAEDTAGSFSSLDITSMRGMMFDDQRSLPVRLICRPNRAA